MSSEFDASDGDKVEERKKRNKRVSDERTNGLKHCASTREGRAWIWSFLEQANPFANPYIPNSDQTQFNLGARLMPVQITEQMLTHCPAEYYLMVSEAREKPKPKENDDA